MITALNPHDEFGIPEELNKGFVSSQFDKRKPASFYAQACIYGATSWIMNPKIEEKTEKGIVDKFVITPLSHLLRGLARAVYSVSIPTICGLAGMVYHPLAAFYCLGRAGAYNVYAAIRPDSQNNLTAIAKEAMLLAKDHSAAAWFDWALMTVFIGAGAGVFPLIFGTFFLDSDFKDSVIVHAAFSYRDQKRKEQTLEDLKGRLYTQ
jgi:hypothetical protein